jgi:hypothetical protein
VPLLFRPATVIHVPICTSRPYPLNNASPNLNRVARPLDCLLQHGPLHRGGGLPSVSGWRSLRLSHPRISKFGTCRHRGHGCASGLHASLCAATTMGARLDLVAPFPSWRGVLRPASGGRKVAMHDPVRELRHRLLGCEILPPTRAHHRIKPPHPPLRLRQPLCSLPRST